MFQHTKSCQKEEFQGNRKGRIGQKKENNQNPQSAANGI